MKFAIFFQLYTVKRTQIPTLRNKIEYYENVKFGNFCEYQITTK